MLLLGYLPSSKVIDTLTVRWDVLGLLQRLTKESAKVCTTPERPALAVLNRGSFGRIGVVHRRTDRYGVRTIC